MPTVLTQNFSMDYFKFGQGTGTLVILPGLSVQSVMNASGAVKQAYSIFSDEYTVYLFDRRTNLPQDYSITAMADDTVEAIRSLDLDNICVFGASQGGMIALDIASRYQGLVKKLVVGSSSAKITGKQFDVIDNWIKSAEERDSEKLYLSFAQAIYPEDFYKKTKGVFSSLSREVSNEELERFIILAKAVKVFNITHNLKNISCPSLVIGSHDDKVFGSDSSEEIYKNLDPRQGNKLYIYNGYGHAAYDTAPDYKERILRFLRIKTS